MFIRCQEAEREMPAGAQLHFFLLSSLGPQPMEWLPTLKSDLPTSINLV